MKRAHVICLLLAALVALLLPGCSSSTAGAPGKGAVVVVLMDLTDSTAADAQHYANSVNTVLKQLKGGDTFYLLSVTRSASVPIEVQATFPEATFNTVRDDQKKAQMIREVQQQVKTALERPRSKEAGTDLFHAIEKAGKLFAAEPGRPHTLVLLSDMMEASAYDFTNAALDPPGPVLEKLAADGLLPRLDADVYIAGVSQGQADKFQISLAQFGAIQRFWKAYFERTGAQNGFAYDWDLLGFQVRR